MCTNLTTRGPSLSPNFLLRAGNSISFLIFITTPIVPGTMLTFVTATATPRKPPASAPIHRRHKSRPSQETLHTLSIALHSWHTRTQTPSSCLPTDSDLRRCQIAKELSLRTLITRAGGYRSVQSIFNLTPTPTSREQFKHRQLCEMTAALRKLCITHSLPPPDVIFPTRELIRELSPPLANRIAAFPGREGYRRLQEYITTPGGGHSYVEEWAVWSEESILLALKRYQTHQRVLPKLCCLPPSIAAAIRRAGGASDFAERHSMVLEKDLANVARFTELVNWLSAEVPFDASDGFVEGVKRQAALAPPFPSTDKIAAAGMTNHLARYGGRRSLATRLGFARESGIKGLFMGPFSVKLAADVLEYGVGRVFVSQDGSVGMPSLECLRSNGKHELADAVGFFGGETAVGRRIGLVPDWNQRGDIE